MRLSHLAYRLILILCLTVGLYVSLLAPAGSAIVLADDPPPPPAEDVQPPDRSSTVPPVVTADEDAGLQVALATLEAARRQGPAAVLALRDALRGKALDLAMNDIVEAQAQLARHAPPRPPTAPVSLVEEEAWLQSQAALDAASRARALTRTDDIAKNQAQLPDSAYSGSSPNALVADRTVGAGCTYATIGAAIAAANSGDRLLLEGGVTFNENLSINGKSLMIQGDYNGCASGSSARSTIDGGGADRVMYIYEGLNIKLENLNITNGNTSGNGAGIFARWNTSLGGTNLNIYSNTSSSLGGGLRLWGGSATFTNTSFHDNVAAEGAGVFAELYNGYAPVLNLPSYADIYSNAALSGNGFGGGVYMREGTVFVADCSDIYSNNAVEGGGAYLVTSTLTIRGDCSEIMLNTATGNGGGIRAQGSTINLDQDAELYSNQAGYGGGVGNGGGAYLDDSDLWGDKALIFYNTASYSGGGVYATNTSLLDMDLGGYACTSPRCSRLSNNTATSVYGGGVYASNSSEVDLRQIFVEGNTANLGGGAYVYQGPMYLYNDLLAGNDATAGVGDGLRLYTGSSLTGSDNTLSHNDAGGATTGNVVGMSGATLTLSNSIVWGHTSGIPTGYTVTCSDIQGGYTGAGNLDVNPLFVNPGSANFHLQSLSPVIDRCATGEAFDFDNESRPVTYIRPAAPYDMGADEAGPRVGLNGAACAYGRIQDAVDAVASGNTIQAATAVFSETVGINGKDLVIAGGYDVDCTTYITGTTTINGSGGFGSVLNVTNSQLRLRDLALTGGNGSTGGGVNVLPGNSHVTLDNTDVFGNQAGTGGGVYVDAGNVLTITHDSDIHDNVATVYGGGVRVWGKFVGNETLSDIYGNSAPDGGGFSVPGGTLILNGSDMENNHATSVTGKGGGIQVYNGGVITLTSTAWLYNNHAAFDGAGIYADDATVNLLGGTVIRDSVAANNGGGVYLTNNSVLHSSGTYIGYPVAGTGNEAVLGAGIYAVTSTVDFNGHVVNNVAGDKGAGIYAQASLLNLTNAVVGGTGAYEANQLGTSGHEGVGLYLINNTRATLNNTVVSSNTFQTTGYTYGGGAAVQYGSVLTLTNSRVERHLAPSTADGRGAGLYVHDAAVILSRSRKQ